MWRSRLMCAVVLLGATAALAQQTDPAQPGRWLGPGWSDGYGWSFWWMCPLMMIAVMAVMAFIMLGRRHVGGMPPGHAALQVLNERFARGEIPLSEYEEKKSAILAG